MKNEIEDILATLSRLADVQAQPPLPLRSHLADRPRDGPDRHPESFKGLERATGQIRPSQRISEFSHHSKGKS